MLYCGIYRGATVWPDLSPRERLSQVSCYDEGCFDSRRRVNSIVRRLSVLNEVSMWNRIMVPVVVGLLLLGSSALNAQKQPDFTDLKLGGDPRCAQMFGVDSCNITLYRGTVTDVIDGQTISITLRPMSNSANDSKEVATGAKTEKRLRLATISAPPLHDPLGAIAKNNLSRLILRKEVVVQFFCGAKNATVTYGQLDAGLEQIKAGLARSDGSQSDAQEYARCNYRFAEEKAQAEHLGVWLRFRLK
jgi:endonuclease YncB( thermonuclease family)